MHGAPRDEMTERLLVRARLLCSTNQKVHNSWQEIFTLTRTLGQLIHAAREYLDSATVPLPIDKRILALWEQGLILPEEIAQGQVTQVVRWYINAIHEQDDQSPHLQHISDLRFLFRQFPDEQPSDVND